MVFAECAEAAKSDARVQVFATDVNPRCVEKARAGYYPRSIAQEVSPERLRRFFIEEGGGYRVRKSIRERCVFSRHNLLADPPFSRVDLISCRNLLIYLEPVLQQRLMRTFHYALKAEGWLWLGSSESVGATSTLFDAADVRHKIFTRRAGDRPASTRARSTSPNLMPAEKPAARGHPVTVCFTAMRSGFAGQIRPAGRDRFRRAGDCAIPRRHQPISRARVGGGQPSSFENAARGIGRRRTRGLAAGGKRKRPGARGRPACRNNDGFRRSGCGSHPDQAHRIGSGRRFRRAIRRCEKDRCRSLSPASGSPAGGKSGAQTAGAPRSATRKSATLRKNWRRCANRSFRMSEQHEAVTEELRSAPMKQRNRRTRRCRASTRSWKPRRRRWRPAMKNAALNDQLGERNAELSRLARELRTSRDYAESIVRPCPRAPPRCSMLLSAVKSANRAFYECFLRAQPEETQGRRIYDLGNRQWDILRAAPAFEEVSPASRPSRITRCATNLRSSGRV